MKSVLLRTLGLMFCAVVALVLWSKYKTVLFPADVTLYVLDIREGGNFPEDLQKLFPSTEQRSNGIQIAVKSVDLADVNSTEAQWQQALEIASRKSGDEMIFFQTPTTRNAKILLSKIYRQLNGAEQVQLLVRTVAFVGAHGDSSSMACMQLHNDWTFQGWNFGGFGLIVDANTLALIGPCLKKTLIYVFKGAA